MEFVEEEGDDGPLTVTQQIFDQMVAAEEAEGCTVSEASAETAESLQEDDITGVFVYADEKEREECVKALQSCLTLAKGLSQGIKEGVACSGKRLALMKGQGVVGSLVAFLQVLTEEEEAAAAVAAEGGRGSGSDSDDDGDEEEERLAKATHALTFLHTLLVTMAAQAPVLVEPAFSFSEEQAVHMCEYFDDAQDDAGVCAAFTALCPLLCGVGGNAALFKACGVEEKVALGMKFHKKDKKRTAELAEGAAALTAVLMAA